MALGLYHQCNLITRSPYNEDWAPNWAYLNLYGDGTLALLDHKDANILYYANQYGHWWRNDDSETSLILDQNVSLGSNQYEYYAEGTLNRKQPNTLYRATKRPNGYTTVINNQGNSVQYLNHEIEILRSFDKGNTNHIISDFRNNWEVTRSGINEYLFDNERVWWLRSSPANPKHLYAGLLNWDWQNRIYRTTIADHPDAQQVIASWHDVPHPRRVALGTLQRQQPPVGFAMDSENENIVYVAYASALFEDPDDFDSPVGIKMVYRLDLSNLSAFPQSGPFDCDGGYPCADLTMNLPNTTIDLDCFAYEQGSDGGLYLSTEVGTYFTNNKRIAAFNPSGLYVNPDDQSNTSGWVRLGGSLPHVSSRGLEINYNVNRIRTGLTGRGVWEHNLYCPEQSTYSESGTYGASAFLEVQQDIISEAIVPSSLKVDYRAGTEVRLTPGFRAEVGSRFHAFIHPCNAPGNSFSVKSGTGDTGDGVNYIEPRHNTPSLLLYPNPAHASLTIVCPALPDQAMAQVRLFDTMGRLVLTRPLLGKSSVLDVSPLRGLFTVVVDIGSAQFTERVVIE